MKEDLLIVEGLTKTFGSKKILSDVNLTIKEGEIHGIIGSSGSGKTTLLNAIIGFVKPEAGSVKFRQRNLVAGTSFGDDVFADVFRKQRQFKQTYGFASQEPSFYEKLTVIENLKYFGSLYDLTKESLNSNIRTLLKLMDLENSSNQLAKNLSGGMERRLDIACSMIHNPDILILDEPTADLDPVLRKNIWDLIREINKRGTTIILSSHHLNELEDLCSRITIIKDSQVEVTSTPDELMNKYVTTQFLLLETQPGNYEAILKDFKKYKEIVSVDYDDSGLKAQIKMEKNILNDLIKKVESKKEKITSLRLVKPNLDQVFFNVSDIK